MKNPLWKEIVMEFFRWHDDINRDIGRSIVSAIMLPVTVPIWIVGWIGYAIIFSLARIFGWEKRR